MTKPLAIAFVIALLAALYFGTQWQKARDEARAFKDKQEALQVKNDSLTTALHRTEMSEEVWKEAAKKSAAESERLRSTRQIIIHHHAEATERVNTADADALLDILAGPR